jgi:signal transduction histidine kinase
MFLKKIKTTFKKIHFRLAFIFSLIFIVSSGILFGFSLFFLYNSMNNSEEEETKRRLLNYWALFQSDGLNSILEEINKESFIYGDRPFFIRIADNTNISIFLRYPEAWSDYSIEQLGNYPINKFENPVTLKTSNSEITLKVYTVFLSENYILQIGISTARSTHLLYLYRRNTIFLIIGLVTLGFGAGAFFSGRFLAPIRNLNSALKDILNTGDFSKRVPSGNAGDDMEEVISLFNTTLERIETLIFQMKENLDIVAHDLRTPMTIFRGYAEQSLRKPNNSQAAEEAISSSLEQSEKIISILDTIMDISEAETGTLKLKKEDINFKELMTSLVEMYEIIADERNINLILNVIECHINVDLVRIRQAIGNIIDNAIKYSPRNSNIKLDIRENESQIILTINDYGKGILEKDIPFIWDRLYRSPDVSNIPGSGLGLSLVKAIIMAHKGSYQASSSPEKGTVFTIGFPKQINITKL